VRGYNGNFIYNSYFLTPSGSTHNAERSGAFIALPSLLEPLSALH
jgi:hypothetical protein